MFRPFFLFLAIFFAHSASGQGSVATDSSQTAKYWQPISEQDILWSKTIWRFINLKDTANKPLRYRTDSPQLSLGMYLQQLVTAGTIKAYAWNDVELTHNLPPDSLAAMGSNWPKSLTGFSIRERWIFDRRMGKMVVRTIAIGPAIYEQDPTRKETHDIPSIDTMPPVSGKGRMGTLFLLRYTDIIPMLAHRPVTITSGTHQITNWLDYFEYRIFSSKITRIENPKVEKVQESQSRRKKRNRRNSDDTGDFWVY